MNIYIYIWQVKLLFLVLCNKLQTKILNSTTNIQEQSAIGWITIYVAY